MTVHHAAKGENSNQPALDGPFSAHHTLEERIALMADPVDLNDLLDQAAAGDTAAVTEQRTRRGHERSNVGHVPVSYRSY